MDIELTNGSDSRFLELCRLLDRSLDDAVGGHAQREEYDKYNGVNATFRAALFLHEDLPVACGCYKMLSDDTAEIKRVFTREDFRGQELAERIMLALEKDAATNGYRFLVLETGKPLKAAIRLYEKLGYERIPNYGQYVCMPLSICMRKEIQESEIKGRCTSKFHTGRSVRP